MRVTGFPTQTIIPGAGCSKSTFKNPASLVGKAASRCNAVEAGEKAICGPHHSHATAAGAAMPPRRLLTPFTALLSWNIGCAILPLGLRFAGAGGVILCEAHGGYGAAAGAGRLALCRTVPLWRPKHPSFCRRPPGQAGRAC